MAPATNPSTNQVLVDTGELTEGNYLLAVTGYSTVAAVIEVEHRNAANDATLDSQRRNIGANLNDDFYFPNKIAVGAQERIRVILVAGITGTIQVSIFRLEVL